MAASPARAPAPAARPQTPAPAPVSAQRPAAPVSAARTELCVLRRTLVVFGVPARARELVAFDAWAAWILLLLGESLHGGVPASVTPLGSHADARHLALELTLSALRATAGMAPEERKAVWSQAQAGLDLVDAMFVRTTRRRS